LYQHSIP